MNPLASLFIFNYISARVLFRTVDHWTSQSLNVYMGNRLWEGQFLCHKNWNTNLIRCYIRIWWDYTSSAEIDSLTHHFHAEHAFFPLKQLSQSRLFSVSSLLCHRWVHEWIDGILELDPFLHCLGLGGTTCSMMSMRIISGRLEE